MEPKFSVILPTHNRALLLKRAVKSVLSQSFSNFELIVVDDGSSDGTQDFLDSLTDFRIRVIHHSLARGVSAARNSGIFSSSGNFIVFLDDDDELFPDFLTQQNDHFVQNPFLGWSWTGIRRVFWGNERSIKEERDQCWMVADHQKRYITQLAASYGVVIRKHWLDQLGGFDESMTVAEDLDLLMRLEMAGVACAPIPEVLIRIHIHSGSSLSRNTEDGRLAQSYRTLINKNMPLMERHSMLWRHQHSSLVGHLYRAGDTENARKLIWQIFCRNPWKLAGIGKFFRFEIKRLKNILLNVRQAPPNN
jgi:glycosyltransferase involved in cell wall biosynthesis